MLLWRIECLQYACCRLSFMIIYSPFPSNIISHSIFSFLYHFVINAVNQLLPIPLFLDEFRMNRRYLQSISFVSFANVFSCYTISETCYRWSQFNTFMRLCCCTVVEITTGVFKKERFRACSTAENG